MAILNDKKKKILFLITKGNWGGAQRYVYDIATSLPTTIFEVVVGLGEGNLLEQKLKERDIRVVPIGLLRRDTSLMREPVVFFKLFSLLFREKPDIVHVNSSKMGAIGVFVARLLGVKRIIFTAHGWAFNELRPRWQKHLIAFLQWLTVLLSHMTITVSLELKRQMSGEPFIKDKMVVIHNGVRARTFLDRETARSALFKRSEGLRRLSESADEDMWIGTLAELHRSKGLEYLLGAAEILVEKYPSLRFVLMGEGQEHVGLEREIGEKNLTRHVFLLGHVDDGPRYLKALDIFVLPSRSEAFGIAILDAGSAGLPALASRVGGIPEIIEHEKTGLLMKPGDAEDIARGLEELINNPAKRVLLGKNLQARVEQEFSFETMLEKTLAVYQSGA